MEFPTINSAYTYGREKPMDENDINDLAKSLLGALQKAASGQAQAANAAAGAANNLKSALMKIATGGQLTADELKEVAKASGRSASSLEDLNKAVKNTGPTIVSLASSLAKGQTSFSTLNGVIQNTADLMGGLMGMIPVVGDGLNALSKAAGKTATFMIERFDDAYGNFEKLSQIGAVGATGIGHVVEGFSRLEVPLSTYANLVGKNSQSLALLSGSAAAGADAFTRAAGDIKESGLDMRLRTLGFSTEEISDTMIAYADLQRRLGSEQAMTQANLKTGAMAYGKELDELARLTGKSREAAQQAQRQQLLDARFNAKLRQMQASGQTEAAEELRKAVTAQQLMGNQQMAQAIMSSATGFFVTPEAQAAVVSMNGFSESVQGLASGMTSARDFSQQIQDQAKFAANQFGPLAQAIGADSPVTKLYVEQTNLASASAGKIAKAFDQAEKDIAKAQFAPEARTVALAEAKVSLEQASSIMSQLVLDQKIVTELVRVTADITRDSAAAIREILNQLAKPKPQTSNQRIADTLAAQQTQTQAAIDSGKLTNAELTEAKNKLVAIEKLQQENNSVAKQTRDAIVKGGGPLGIQVGPAIAADKKQQEVAKQTQQLIDGTTTINNTVAPAAPTQQAVPSAVAPAAPTQRATPSAVPPTTSLPNMPSVGQATPSAPAASIDNGALQQIAANTATNNTKLDALSASVDKLSRSMLS